MSCANRWTTTAPDHLLRELLIFTAIVRVVRHVTVLAPTVVMPMPMPMAMMVMVSAPTVKRVMMVVVVLVVVVVGGTLMRGSMLVVLRSGVLVGVAAHVVDLTIDFLHYVV